MQGKIRTARKPDRTQSWLIRKAGLDPEKWLVLFQDMYYLHLVDRGMEQREPVIIDRLTGEIAGRRRKG